MENTIEDYEYLPYRIGVGLMIINEQNKIFVGRRIDSKVDLWQMPQGGVDKGEAPHDAALREMLEEIGSNKGVIIAQSNHWYSYNIPKNLIAKFWDGTYCGQTQKWFLIRFQGTDEDINLTYYKPEFNNWRWISPTELLDIIVPFKKKLYNAVMEEFKLYLA